MIEQLDSWIALLFIGTAILTLLFFYFANNRATKLSLAILVWSIFQSVLAYNGFYQNSNAVPPRFLLVLLPTSLVILYSLLSRHKEWIIKNRNTQISTLSHVVRIPVEIVLHQLFLSGKIPELMSFEGWNFDILAGITAPVIALLLIKEKLGKRALLIWNYIALVLVLFILTLGVLSAELPIQQLAFDQPNVALNYFPFILLASTIVPIVVWTHLTDILKLQREISA